MNYGSNYFDGSGAHGGSSDMYSQQQKDDEITRLRARVAELEAELRENEGVIAVWRRRTQEAEAAQEWRPIESAPRDGTSIIAYRPSDPPAIEAMYWVNYEDCGGDWHWSYDSDVPASSPPTHWLPLPALPKVAT